jgi:acetyl-CoA/propionyl-CoA carboxylase biotin carboxyl carrier protein
MFARLLIANRGEIAVRIARTCRELGVETVAVYSEPDTRAYHVRASDRALPLPGVTVGETYARAPAILDAARRSGAEAVHPGYGFLSESASFAAAVIEAGLIWVGPPPEATAALGDKLRARAIAAAAGVPVVPGLDHPVVDAAEVQAWAEGVGYPLALKAAGGGGGRGLRVARRPTEVAGALVAARREAEAYFGSGDVYVERYLEAPRHLEVQILAPGPDVALWLGVRDCSLQRRHQKLVEETPPAGFTRVEEMGAAATAVAKASAYVGAGTVEFLAEGDGSFYFLEVNARLQVEHTVTEEVFGTDLVAGQLRIAAGEELGFGQADLVARGHAIECRINAEDPARGFTPSPGRLLRYREPGGPGVRVDSGYAEGDVVPPAYDSLIAKLVTRGATRTEARRRMLRALDEFEIEGLATTIPAHRRLLADGSFVAATHTTRTVEDSDVIASLPPVADVAGTGATVLVGGRPARLWHPAARAEEAGTRAALSGEVAAPMAGTVLALLVVAGQEVAAGEPVAVVEAMKMETTLEAPVGGRVAEVGVAEGEVVTSGRLVARIE